MKNTSLKSSRQQSELNALAPLRLPGLAQALRDNCNDPAEVLRIADEIDGLVPHIFELLLIEGEKTPPFDAPLSLV